MEEPLRRRRSYPVSIIASHCGSRYYSVVFSIVRPIIHSFQNDDRFVIVLSDTGATSWLIFFLSFLSQLRYNAYRLLKADDEITQTGDDR